MIRRQVELEARLERMTRATGQSLALFQECTELCLVLIEIVKASTYGYPTQTGTKLNVLQARGREIISAVAWGGNCPQDEVC